MYADMEFWTKVRRRVLTGELSKRAACREYELSWHTLAKILAHQEPPGYRRKQPRRKPKLEQFLPIIHEILQQDGQAPKKQRHTAWRIFERLRDEHGFTGGHPPPSASLPGSLLVLPVGQHCGQPSPVGR